MSGQPRPEQNDPAGLVHGAADLRRLQGRAAGRRRRSRSSATAPTTRSIVTRRSRPTRTAARSSTELDRSGATAYFAMAQLPRNNAIDRLESIPVTMDGRAGMRLILSSEKRSSTDGADRRAVAARQAGAVDARRQGARHRRGPPDQRRDHAVPDRRQGGKRTVLGHAMPAAGRARSERGAWRTPTSTAKADLPAGTVDVQGPRRHEHDRRRPGGRLGADRARRRPPTKGDFTGAIESKTADDGTVRHRDAGDRAGRRDRDDQRQGADEPAVRPHEGAAARSTSRRTGRGTGKPEADVRRRRPIPSQVLFAETSLDPQRREDHLSLGAVPGGRPAAARTRRCSSIRACCSSSA